MLEGKYKIQCMEKEDLKVMMEYGMIEDWEYSLDTVDPYYNIDQKGFFKGVIANKIISTILAIRYPGNFAHIGYYFVLPEYRKQGYGLSLFKKALEHCDDCTIGLVSSDEQVKNYEKIGFTISDNIRFYVGKFSRCDDNANVLQYDEKNHFDFVSSYDQDCFPGDRTTFLRSWLKKPNTHTFVYFDQNDKKFKGYASIYQNNQGWSISPCYCDNKDIAKSLIGALVNLIGENDLFSIIVTEINQSSIDLVNETIDIYNWEHCGTHPRMYKNGRPNINLQKCFSFVSSAIG